jgi:hypothetical protein
MLLVRLEALRLWGRNGDAMILETYIKDYVSRTR